MTPEELEKLADWQDALAEAERSAHAASSTEASEKFDASAKALREFAALKREQERIAKQREQFGRDWEAGWWAQFNRER